jgi:hypothetical protein
MLDVQLGSPIISVRVPSNEPENLFAHLPWLSHAVMMTSSKQQVQVM